MFFLGFQIPYICNYECIRVFLLNCVNTVTQCVFKYLKYTTLSHRYLYVWSWIFIYIYECSNEISNSEEHPPGAWLWHFCCLLRGQSNQGFWSFRHHDRALSERQRWREIKDRQTGGTEIFTDFKDRQTD